MQHGGSILELVAALPSQVEQDRCLAIIREEERLGFDNMRLNTGIDATLQCLVDCNLRAAIVTRNNHHALDHFWAKLEGHGLGALRHRFAPCLARDALCPVQGQPLRNKPAPDPAVAVLRSWDTLQADLQEDGGFAPGSHSHVLMVGDHLDDLTTGRAAGCQTCFLTNQQHQEPGSHAWELLNDKAARAQADHVVHDGQELAQLIATLAQRAS
jgi:phosphoglycolate phosphatase-like HAD superfamily hydrolase